MPTSSSTVKGMDVLAEEFGSLTPEQLVAPIPTVEVSAESVGSGRGWRRLKRRCRESFWEDEGGALSFCACPGDMHMLRAPRVSVPKVWILSVCSSTSRRSLSSVLSLRAQGMALG